MSGRAIGFSEFSEIYREALSYGFAALGTPISRVVSDYLSRKYGVTPANTFESPRLLSEALEKTLGYGSVLIEKRIVKNLHTRLALPLDVQPWIRMGHPEDFETCVREVRDVAASKSASP